MRSWMLFVVTLTLLASGADWARAQQRIDVQAVITAADVNHDGQIDRVEYLRRMSEAFFFVDANKDGFLTKQEIQQTIAGANPERVAAADTNADGKLSMYEYHQAIAQNFDEADTDRNGLLSMQEIKTRWGSPTG
jgi:Ca2+-binding EF-hand superfamily protein